MDINSMTGDPSQEGRKTIFDFEAYPAHNVTPIDWSRIPMGQASIYIPPDQFNPNLNYQQSPLTLGNFSFCTTATPIPAQFPFPNLSTTSPPSFNNALGTTTPRCKRKTDFPPLQPAKQHITEEKMAEHLSKLHISSETVTTKETQTAREKRLYMCEEMRRLQSDSILPQSLLSKIQRPCTALVLWTPPRRLLNLSTNNDENGNNNEETQPDNNRMEDVNIEENHDGNIVNNMDFDV